MNYKFLKYMIFYIFATSCVSSTLIKMDKPGVKIYADGNLLGAAPVTYSDTKMIGSNTIFMLKKPGCATQTVMINRSEEFQLGPCIGGIFVGVPFLWVMGYKPERTWHFECEAVK